MLRAKEQLNFAGWLSITNAAVEILIAGWLMFSDYFEMEHPSLSENVIDGILIFTSVGLFVCILLFLRKLLNSRFQFHDVDTPIENLIWFSVGLFIFNLLALFIPRVALLFLLAFFALQVGFGITYINFGVRILRLPNDLYGLLKPYSYTTIAVGLLVFVFGFLSIAYILTLIGKGVLLLGVVVGVISAVWSVILGMIFFRAAEWPLSNSG